MDHDQSEVTRACLAARISRSDAAAVKEEAVAAVAQLQITLGVRRQLLCRLRENLEMLQRAAAVAEQNAGSGQGYREGLRSEPISSR